MKKIKRLLAVLLTFILSLSLLTGCGASDAAELAGEAATAYSAWMSSSEELAQAEDAEADDISEEEEAAEEIAAGQEESAQAETGLDPDGSYTSKEDVALYLHTYGELPANFITKKEAKSLGWSGGSLEPYAPGKCIGGDKFGNYEGVLPEDATYHECDIDTLGAEKRGAKRIVFDTDGNIYYTEDHYEHFEQLYEG